MRTSGCTACKHIPSRNHAALYACQRIFILGWLSYRPPAAIVTQLDVPKLLCQKVAARYAMQMQCNAPHGGAARALATDAGMWTRRLLQVEVTAGFLNSARYKEDRIQWLEQHHAAIEVHSMYCDTGQREDR
jgi:hypothetical protein